MNNKNRQLELYITNSEEIETIIIITVSRKIQNFQQNIL